MSAPGDIRYARTRDGIDIAYTVFGEGPDLLVAPGFVTHLDLMWDFPFFLGIAGLGKYFRVIVFDKRGSCSPCSRSVRGLRSWPVRQCGH